MHKKKEKKLMHKGGEVVYGHMNVKHSPEVAAKKLKKIYKEKPELKGKKFKTILP